MGKQERDRDAEIVENLPEGQIIDLEEDSSLSLEILFENLEDIVQQMEEEDTPLELALELFEEGIKQCRLASQRLNDAKQRIDQLMQDPETGEDTITEWEEIPSDF